jgi:hypothetical protein
VALVKLMKYAKKVDVLVALREFKHYTIVPEQWNNSATNSCKFAVDQNANLSLKIISKEMIQ